jgi:hypothetical protein
LQHHREVGLNPVQVAPTRRKRQEKPAEAGPHTAPVASVKTAEAHLNKVLKAT